MNFLIIVIVSYFILAIVNLADKFILGNMIPNSKAYTFFVGVLGCAVVLLSPFFLVWCGWRILMLNILVGAFFPIALTFMYRSLKIGDTSKMITLVGGTIPIFTVIMSIFILGEVFTKNQWLGIALLIVGTIIIAWLPNKKTLWHKISVMFGMTDDNPKRGIIEAILSALFYALFFIGTKYLYSIQPFWSGFIWIRLGTLIAVLTFLINKSDRIAIFNSFKSLMKGKNKLLFFGNQGLAGVGFVLQNYAIALGSVALVNAMQGIQYVFLIVLGFIITMFKPRAIKEDISKSIIIQKIIAILLIGIGLFFVAK
ncbi:MAG: DMT family transporter [Patescibacteria group bacterium]|nr:DMT family transporter [Patescibacteria group bacterium]